jgi:hypothetical protein
MIDRLGVGGRASAASVSWAARSATLIVASFCGLASTFASLTAGPKERIVISEVNCNVLVPMGTAPTGSLWVGPRDIANTGWLGTYQAQFKFDKASNFSGTQDRYASSRTTSIILEPGQTLTWHLTNADGEETFTPVSWMAANLSIRAETTTLP